MCHSRCPFILVRRRSDFAQLSPMDPRNLPRCPKASPRTLPERLDTLCSCSCLVSSCSVVQRTFVLNQHFVSLIREHHVCHGVTLCSFSVSLLGRASVHKVVATQSNPDWQAQLAKDEAHLPCKMPSDGISSSKARSCLHTSVVFRTSCHQLCTIWLVVRLDFGIASVISDTQHCRAVFVAWS